MTFEASRDTGPHRIYTHAPSNDPHELLPPAAQRKFTALMQRSIDLHSAIPPFNDLNEAAKAQIDHENRIASLTRHKAQGGFGLDQADARVADEGRKLERATAERNRLQELTDVRSARWSACKQLERAVSDWVLRGGIPGGSVLEIVEDQPLSVLLTKGDGGRIEAACERYRMRLRELAADRHRVNSSPWPSSVAKERAKALVEQLAEQGAPNCDHMIEHGAALTLPTVLLSSLVRGTDKPAVATVEVVDAAGLIAWALKDQLLAKISAGIDDVADDKAALSEPQRQKMLVEISADELATERLEVACIWHAEAAGTVIDFRAGTSPLALLGVRTVAAPAANGARTSRGMGFVEVVEPGRRR